MIIQFTRFYLAPGTGAVLHCHSQTTPFPDNFEPVETPNGTDKADCQITTNFPDHDFRLTQPIMRARELLTAIELPAGVPQKNPAAPKPVADLVESVAPAAITDTLVRAEYAATLAAVLAVVELDQAAVLAEYAKINPSVATLADLDYVTLFRLIKKVS